RPAVLVQPVPDDLDELLAPRLLAGGALREQVLLDDVLRRDARMVVTRQEGRFEAAHAVPAHQQVGQRDLQRVAGVQRAGDVGRRVGDDEGLAARSALGVGAALLPPRSLPALLAALRLVERLHSGKFTKTWVSSFTRSGSSGSSSPTSA